MQKKNYERRCYDANFKLTVLKDYYEHDLSKSFVCKKYGILSKTTLERWLKEYSLKDKSLSLSETTIERISAMRRKKSLEKSALSNKCKEELLEEENARLRQALEYSELRNEGLQEILKICREEYGIDLLKKAGAKQ